MTLRSAIAAIAVSTAAIAAAAQAQPAGSALTLSFHGITEQRGAVMAAVFDSEDAYAGRGAPVRAVRLDASGERVSTRIEGLAPGRYAIKAFHDVDGDGQMDTNPFGLPTEPYAFSNDAQGEMGPATYAQAAFTVVAGETDHAIAIR